MAVHQTKSKPVEKLLCRQQVQFHIAAEIVCKPLLILVKLPCDISYYNNGILRTSINLDDVIDVDKLLAAIFSGDLQNIILNFV